MRSNKLLLPALFASSASAWGMLGHRTVAILASRYLLPETEKWIHGLLPAPENMMKASTWPDFYAHTDEGRYSAPWHWIDAKDDPPRTCGVDYNRDCPPGEGCIVSAIANMTSRVTDEGLSFHERQMALKFIIHFIGDIHQPLHTESYLRGGNDMTVYWGRRKTNLHHIWDSDIPEDHQGGSTVRHAVEWAHTLYVSLDLGDYIDRDFWAECVDPTKAEECALEWAWDSNRWMCGYVLAQSYPGGLEGLDLRNTEYSAGAAPIVDLLVAKAGWRLAGYLNMIATGSTGLDKLSLSETSKTVNDKHWASEERGHRGQTILGGTEEELLRQVARGVKKAFGRATGWWGNARAN